MKYFISTVIVIVFLCLGGFILHGISGLYEWVKNDKPELNEPTILTKFIGISLVLFLFSALVISVSHYIK